MTLTMLSAGDWFNLLASHRLMGQDNLPSGTADFMTRDCPVIGQLLQAHVFCHVHSTPGPCVLPWTLYSRPMCSAMATLLQAHVFCHGHSTPSPCAQPWPLYSRPMCSAMATLLLAPVFCHGHSTPSPCVLPWPLYS